MYVFSVNEAISNYSSPLIYLFIILLLSVFKNYSFIKFERPFPLTFGNTEHFKK